MIREGVAAALQACGHEVVDLGLVSTPVLQHAIHRLGAGGGVSIGASHNAAPWNALKFFGPDGAYLTTGEAGELLDIYHLHKFDYRDWTAVGSLREDHTALEHYLDDLAAVYPLDRLRSLRVVVDCCNGTSSRILERMNERFGTQFILINAAPQDRDFAHEPAISAATVSLQLAPLVKPLQAAAGFLFDADSDRVALATEHGHPVTEEMILPLLADHVLPRGPGKIVITNLSTTGLTEVIAQRHRGSVVRVPVGRQAAADALSMYRPDQIALAGEGSGAIMLPQFRFVYDGIASMLAVLEMSLERDAPVSQLLSSYPRYSMLKGQVPLSSPRIPLLLMSLQEQFQDGHPNAVDGLRVEWPDRWFHVRVSQTEPVIRVICEAQGDAPVALFDQLMEAVRSYA